MAKTRYKCPECGRPCRGKQGFVRHWIHPSNDDHIGKPPENPPETEEKPGQIVSCDECGNSLRKKPSHIKDHNFCNRECFSKWLSENENFKEKLSRQMTGRKTPKSSRRKMSQAAMGNQRGGSSSRQKSGTGRMVRSGWEAEIDVMLENSEYDHIYEKEFIFEDGSSYSLDFLVEDEVAIEVKGRIFNKRSVERAQKIMDEYDHHYVVIGAELPHDSHLIWENRGDLIGVIDSCL